MAIVLTYDQAALASGNSRRFFVLAALRAIFMIGGLLVGLEIAGLFGALVSQGVAMIAVYPAVVWLVRGLGAWDPLHDAIFALVAAGICAAAVYFNWDAVQLISAAV